MEEIIISPSIIYFLIFSFFLHNILHANKKINNNNLSGSLFTFLSLGFFIASLVYVILYSYKTEWYAFPLLIITAIIVDIIVHGIILLSVILFDKIGISAGMSLYSILRNKLVSLFLASYCGIKMFQLI